MARKHVVVFVCHRRVQGVLALLGVAKHAAWQQDRDPVLGIETTAAACAAPRFAGHWATTIGTGQIYSWWRTRDKRHDAHRVTRQIRRLYSRPCPIPSH